MHIIGDYRPKNKTLLGINYYYFYGSEWWIYYEF